MDILHGYQPQEGSGSQGIFLLSDLAEEMEMTVMKDRMRKKRSGEGEYERPGV